MKPFLTQIVQSLAYVSSILKLDLLWRVVGCLTKDARVYLLVRLLREAQVDLLTLRCGDTVWTVFAWDSEISKGILEHGGYQTPEINAVLSWMEHRKQYASDRRVIVDVGANIGTSSIPFAQRTSCRVIAIEPAPENFALLQRNVRQNGLEERITCVPMAVSDVRGQVEMALPDKRSGGAEIKQAGAVPSMTASGGKIKNIIEVSADLLTNILTTFEVSPRQVAFVWADIQGHEPHLIRSGEPLWRAGVPLFMEVDPLLLRTQRGFECLPELCARHFGSFIESRDLIRHGAAALAQPIAALASLLRRLDDSHGSTDALLLPVSPR